MTKTVIVSNDTRINSLWNFGDPDKTRKSFERLYMTNAVESDLDFKLQLKTQIARTYSLQSKFPQADETLDEVELKLTPKTVIANIRYLLERGRTRNSAGESAAAKKLFESAYSAAIKVKSEVYSIDAAHMIAIASSSLTEKNKWNQLGLRHAKNSRKNRSRSWIGVFYNNIGWDQFKAKKYESALESFEACKEFHSRPGASKQSYNIAVWSIAKTYRYLGRIDEALMIQIDQLQSAKGLDKGGYIYEELAELYLQTGKSDKSKEYFKKAHEVLAQDVWLQKNESQRLERLLLLSR